MEKIKLFQADIDIDQIIKRSSELKQEINSVAGAIKTLKDNNDTSSASYVKLEGQLKKLRSEYNLNQKLVTNMVTEKGKLLSTENKLDIAMQTEVRNIQQAIKNNAELRVIRNQINEDTVEGAKAIREINDKIDQNTKLIERNSSSLEKLKMNVGNYKNDIKSAFEELNIFNGGLLGFVSRAEKAGGVTNLVNKSITKVTLSIQSLTKATLAFIATPIGAILAIIGAAFLLIKNAMDKNTASAEKLTKVFNVFGKILQPVFDLLLKLGDFLIDGLVAGLEMATKAIEKILGGISKVLNFLGFDKASKSVENYKNQVFNATTETSRFIREQQKLNDMIKQNIKNENTYRKAIEDLRKVRDDDNKTIGERIGATLKLREVQMQQLNEQLAAAKQALKIAQVAIAVEKHLGIETEGVQKKYRETYAAMLAIEEQINAFLEQSTNQERDLRKQAHDEKMKLLDEAIKKQETELDMYITSQGIRKKTLQEELDFTKEIFDKQNEIEKQKLENGKITQEDYALFLEKHRVDLGKKLADIAVKNAEEELQIFKDLHQSKIDANKFLSEELYKSELERIDKIAEAERAYHQKRFEEGVISAQDYNAELRKIDEENQAQIDELNAQREEAIKEKEIIDLENKRAAQIENLEYDLEFQLQELELKRQQEVDAAEKTGADIALINEKYAKLEQDLKQTVADNKMNLMSQTYGSFATILGKETMLGKAAATAQATIDTYQAAVSAYKAMSGIPIVGPALGAVAAGAAVAAGISNIKKINSTKLPKAEKGSVFDIRGKRHSAGGTKFYGEDGTAFEAEQGEKLFVLNRRASAAIAPILSDINQKYGGVPLSKSTSYLAAGGEVARAQIEKQQSFDFERMSEMIVEGVREGSREGTMIGANQGTYSGIVDKELNEIISEGANF